VLINKTTAVLDIGTSKVALTIGSRGSNGEVAVLGYGACPYPGFRDGLWMDARALPEAIRTAKAEAEKQAKKKVRDLYVGIPGEFINLYFREAKTQPQGKGGKIHADDLKRVLQNAADFPVSKEYQPLYRIPVAYTLDGNLLRTSPVGMSGKELGCYVSLIMGDIGFMDSMEQQLGDLGLGVIDYLPAPTAEGAWVARAMPSGDADTIVVVDSGHFSTDVVVVQGSYAVFHKSLNVGGHHFTSDLSQVLGLSMEQADVVKRRCSVGMSVPMGDNVTLGGETDAFQVDMDLAQQVMEARMEDTADRVTAALASFDVEPDSHVQLYMTGDGYTKVRGAREFFSQRMGLTVRVFSPKSPVLTAANAVTSEALLMQVLSPNGSGQKGTFLQNIVQNFKDFF
jgi:cell division protein FtsA